MWPKIIKYIKNFFMRRIISIFSIKVMLFVATPFSLKAGFTALQNFLLTVTFFIVMFEKYLIFSFLKEEIQRLLFSDRNESAPCHYHLIQCFCHVRYLICSYIPFFLGAWQFKEDLTLSRFFFIESCGKILDTMSSWKFTFSNFL